MKLLTLLIPVIPGFLYLFPLISAAQNIDFGKSYINVTKGVNGGTIEPGDTLEIRASFVVRSGTYDSCAYYDVIPTGTSYVPGTVRVRTNEGKTYKSFTDPAGDDEGWITGSNVRINLGYNQTASPARWFRRGRIANTHRPSIYGGTCIMVASFRVRVTASFNSVISTGRGSITYKNSTAPIQTYTFPANNVAVYRHYGICSNTIGSNSLGTEFNGTFGAGDTRNRGASANVPTGYTYDVFTTNSPQDYYYGIANNTSTRTGYTTVNSWAKPDNSSPTHRVFNVWDIIGDHTAAASLTAGNPATDTAANPNAGYMLVINAAYRIDSAFQHTISGLCPNTYYEISCWMRNICSKCGCDSAGRGTTTAGYIPSAPGDSSGVNPNITFEVDGVDYYTTGNLSYSGQWVKKGFTFLTGATQTSFTLKFFNNAPGGGGNDWALDDISVATCSPDLIFTPTNNPTVCRNNVVDMSCIIKSYFNNYTQYEWQKSSDNGATWVEAGSSGTGTPEWNGSEWEYKVYYPQFVATAADHGKLYRVLVATTAANLNSAACAFTATSSVITLTVYDCQFPLLTEIISFSGKIEREHATLTWTTSKEKEALNYIVEKSTDGRTFTAIATVSGYINKTSETNIYTWQEKGNEVTETYYRIVMVSANDNKKLSRTIKLGVSTAPVQPIKILNPFHDKLEMEIKALKSGIVQVELIDATAKTVRKEIFKVTAGSNKLILYNTAALPNNVYTLKIQIDDSFTSKKVVKSSYR